MKFKRIGIRAFILFGFIIFGVGWKVDHPILTIVLILSGMCIIEVGYIFDNEYLHNDVKL